MRLEIFKVGFLAVALIAPCGTWAQQTTTRTVIIQVGDESGAPVPHAKLRLLPPPDGTDAKLETDENGALSLNLKPGSYVLTVTEPGFKYWSESIFVANPEEKAGAAQVYPVVLRVGSYSGPTIVYPDGSLVISAGPYNGVVALSPAEFRALPHVTLTVHNAHSNADEKYSGVLLATLLVLVKAPIGKDLPKDALTNYLVASGSDGYSVVLSLAEVDPGLHAGQVLVADALDGHPLGKSGPYQLIVSEDKRPARWVHNLNSIALQALH